MTEYFGSGTLTTDTQVSDDLLKWHSQSEWEEYASKHRITIEDGIVRLREFPNLEDFFVIPTADIVSTTEEIYDAIQWHNDGAVSFEEGDYISLREVSA